MRRRRKFKGTWFPNIGIVQNDITVSPTAGREMVIQLANNTAVGGVLPLTFDAPAEPDSFVDDVPMSYLQGNEYAIRRVVGKFHIDVRGPGGRGDIITDLPPCALVTAGLFIARASDDEAAGASAAYNFPIGWTEANQALTSYNPDIPDTIREPWIWRRQWVLANSAVYQQTWADLTQVLPAATLTAMAYPLTTGEYGSVLDGPHVDAKTRRRISSDDRLWLTVWAQPYPRGNLWAQAALCEVGIHFDYRIFGQMRRGRNRGNF